MSRELLLFHGGVTFFLGGHFPLPRIRTPQSWFLVTVKVSCYEKKIIFEPFKFRFSPVSFHIFFQRHAAIS